MIFEEIAFIGFVFCLAFGLRSIFGFGGTIFALTILAFFFDVKEIVVLGAFAGMVSAFIIVLSDLKSFYSKAYFSILFFMLPGLLIGTFFLESFSSNVIQYIFGLLLIFYATYTIFAPNFVIPKFFKPFLNFLGGIFGGTLGTSGPFLIAAMRETFGDKSRMRTTLSAIYLTIDMVRIPIYFYLDIYQWDKITPFWWVIFPLCFTIWLGFRIHSTMSERTFQIALSVMLGISGIVFLLK